MNIHPYESSSESKEPSPRYNNPARFDVAADFNVNDDDAFGLSDLIQKLWLNKLTIILATALCAGISAWQVSQQTPLYTAAARVALNTRQDNVIDVKGVVPQLTTDYGTINTEVQVLKSRDLMSRVVDALSLQNDPEFNPSLRIPSDHEGSASLDELLRWIGVRSAEVASAPIALALPPQQAHELATDILLSRVAASNVTDSYVFQITVATTAPRKSADIANKVAELYVDGQRDVKFKALEDAMGWLSKRVVALKEELEAAEGEVEKFSASAHLVNPQMLIADTQRLKAMRDHRTEQADTARQIRDGIARFQKLRAQGDFAKLAEQIDVPLVSRAARELASGPANPAVEARFDAAFGPYLDGLRSDAQNADLQAREIDRAIADLKAHVDAQSSDLVTMRQLKREAEAARLIYESFLNRLKEISVQQGIQQADSRVLSLAEVPGGPSSPDKQQSILKGGAIGLVLGIIFMSIQNALRNAIRSPEDLETLTGLTVIGVIPDGRIRRPGSLIELVVNKPASSIIEAVQNLRTAIQLSNVDAAPRVVVVTSSVPDEGKSILASILASTAAKAGKKVLLVDADLRRRLLREYFGVASDAGLVSLLSGSTGFEEAVHRDERTGLDLIVADDGKVTPVDFFDSKQFENFIATVREQYDLVVLDTPPVLAVPDTRIIAQHADAVVYTVRWNSTKRRMIQSGLTLLQQVNVRVSGLALTRVDPKRMDRYGYYGYGYGGNRLQKYYSN